jgi:protocatechuate 3,4-dioxygenase, alpha subunit
MGRTPTPSQTVGPFFGFALPFDADSDAGGDERIEGRVLDGAGQPVSDALLELSQGEQFARCRTDAEGAFHFSLRRPDEGFVDVTVFARGLLRHLQTRIYFPDAEGSVPPGIDSVRRHTLVARRDGAVLHHDIHLQGEHETVFFAR